MKENKYMDTSSDKLVEMHTGRYDIEISKKKLNILRLQLKTMPLRPIILKRIFTIQNGTANEA